MKQLFLASGSYKQKIFLKKTAVLFWWIYSFINLRVIKQCENAPSAGTVIKLYATSYW